MFRQLISVGTGFPVAALFAITPRIFILIDIGPPAMLLKYFDVTPASPLEDFEREVLHHPVFEVNTLVAGQAEEKPLEPSESK